MQGQKNEKVSSRLLYVWVNGGCDGLGKASWRRWHLHIHHAINKPFQAGGVLLQSTANPDSDIWSNRRVVDVDIKPREHG